MQRPPFSVCKHSYQFDAKQSYAEVGKYVICASKVHVRGNVNAMDNVRDCHCEAERETRNAKYVSERCLPEAEATFRDIQDDDLAVHFSESLTKSS